MNRIGTDIELFILNKEGNPVNPFEFVKGTKQQPFEWKPRYYTSLDCVCIEYNTPPRASLAQFSNDIKESINYIKSIIPNDHSISFFPSYEFDKKELHTEESMTFGCDEDFDAYNGRPNKIVEVCKENTTRSAGMHLHIDFSIRRHRKFIQCLDLYLALPALLMEPFNSRKELYGKAGAFRKKSYGIEYRVLSSWFQQEKYLEFIWNGVAKATEHTLKNKEIPKNIKNIINSNNIVEANKITYELNLLDKNHENLILNKVVANN